jgi:cobalt/nickel transport protein
LWDLYDLFRKNSTGEYIMRLLFSLGVCGFLLLISSGSGYAHFQTLLPSVDIVNSPVTNRIGFDIRFTHPMEAGPVMEMGEPLQFGVLLMGENHDLKNLLAKREIDGRKAYGASYVLAAPGDHVFYIEPAPYWEQAEQKSIIHYTKVVVDGFGAEEGWDALVGFPVEIEPLVRPYGLWTGNLFRGVVRKNGKPLPNAVIEIEYWNPDRNVSIPAAPFTKQVVKADTLGVFSYAMPRAGWWGFAALVEETESADNKKQGGTRELGGLIWVRVQDML